MKQLEVQDRRFARHRIAVKAAGHSADAMFPTNRPAVRAGDDAHPIRSKHIEFRRRGVFETGGFEISVPRHLQVAIESFEQFNAGLLRVGPR